MALLDLRSSVELESFRLVWSLSFFSSSLFSSLLSEAPVMRFMILVVNWPTSRSESQLGVRGRVPFFFSLSQAAPLLASLA